MQPDLVVDLSMRRDLARALGALERHELDFAFGNAVWRTADPHPDLAGVLRAVEAAGRRSEAAADTWLPRAARER